LNFPVKITSTCVDHIKKVRQDYLSSLPNGVERNLVVRLSIDPLGKSGVSPAIEFDKDYALGEQTGFIEHEISDVLFVIQNKWIPYLQGMTLDYHRGLTSEGFTFSKSGS